MSAWWDGLPSETQLVKLGCVDCDQETIVDFHQTPPPLWGEVLCSVCGGRAGLYVLGVRAHD